MISFAKLKFKLLQRSAVTASGNLRVSEAETQETVIRSHPHHPHVEISRLSHCESLSREGTFWRRGKNGTAGGAVSILCWTNKTVSHGQAQY